MKCVECNAEMRVGRSTKERPYHFDRCGLDEVYLIGIELHTCPRCGIVYPVIPRIQELHREIASELIKKPLPLLGQEVRYLRRWMGEQAKDFAALLGFSPEYLSRIENGSIQLGAAGDRLVRIYAMTMLDRLAFEEIREKIGKLGRRSKGARKAHVRRSCQLHGARWSVEEEAA